MNTLVYTIVLAVCSFALNVGSTFPKASQIYRIRLTKVIDGDTVRAEVIENQNENIRIRFVHIDAPEQDQPYGQQAKEYLENVLNGQTADQLLTFHRTGRDQYRRLLGTIYLGQFNVEKSLVANGYSWCYLNECPQDYHDALNSARSRGLGLWHDKNPIPPWEFRRRSRGYNMNTSRNSETLQKGRSYSLKSVMVIDGDTITVQHLKRKKKRLFQIRLDCIDAPEIEQQFGRNASLFLKSLLKKNKAFWKMKFVFNYKNNLGQYVGQINAKRIDIGRSMLTNGYAWTYHQPQASCPANYDEEMQQARNNRVGLWRAPNPEPPWLFRVRQSTQSPVSNVVTGKLNS